LLAKQKRNLQIFTVGAGKDIMTKIEAIIRPSRFDVVKDALADVGVDGMTVSETRGHGRQKGHTETYRGREYEIDLVPKLRIEMIVMDDRVEPIIDAILASAGTGEIGDGKIFLFKTEDAIRIRNHERGEIAI
jgi:nitrogen regulatory protein P-II 1